MLARERGRDCAQAGETPRSTSYREYMDYAFVGMVLPVDRQEMSWTAVPLTDYVRDIGLFGDDLHRQVMVDVPRMRVTLEIIDMQRKFRIKHGDMLEHICRTMIPRSADLLLAISTQASLAAPLRAITTELSSNVVVSELEHPRGMDVSFSFRNTNATVSVRKDLGLRDVDTMKMLRTITLIVEACSDAEHVMVGIQ